MQQTEPSPRRTKVKGRRGTYFKVGRNGRRRYEFVYQDSDGRQRWQTVDGGLEEAEAAREEVRAKLRRGERVAPTRQTFALGRNGRPPLPQADVLVLSPDEIGELLEAAPVQRRPLIATAAFTGLRIAELLGLTWADIDFDGGVVRVRYQLDKKGSRVLVKTRHGARDVVLMPALGRVLREHRLRSVFSGDGDFVFPSRTGRGWGQTTAGKVLRKAADDAGLSLTFHTLRHTFASLLIAGGQDPVFVSRQLGHSSPSFTLDRYSHLFDRARHADRVTAALEAGYGKVLESSGGKERASEPSSAPSNVAPLRTTGNHG